MQKIIDYEETGVIDYDLYSLLINPGFQAVVLSEIMNDKKSQKEEFDIVLDLSGYEICVYRNEKKVDDPPKIAGRYTEGILSVIERPSKVLIVTFAPRTA